MPNPAFIVEGQMEQRFVQRICQGRPVRLLNCNGDDVSIRAIAERLRLQLSFLKNYYPVIIIFDRERRNETCEEIEEKLLALLIEFGWSIENIIVGVPDRTIENWILADPAALAAGIDGTVPKKNHEGTFGKNVLRSILGAEGYGETTTGVHLLGRVRPRVAAENSASFARFLGKLEIECWWLQSD